MKELQPQGEFSSWCDAYARDHAERLAVDFDIVEALDPECSARILDIGAIPPVLSMALAAAGHNVCGVDLAPERFPNTGLEIHRCDIELERLPFPDSAFDVVLLNEVFEHLRIDPRLVAGEIGRVLSPGGILALSTPNMRSHRGVFSFLVRGYTGWCGAQDLYAQYDKLDTLGHMGHVREYSSRDLSTFFSHFDLSLELVIWRGRDPRAVLHLADRLIPSLSPFMSLVFRAT